MRIYVVDFDNGESYDNEHYVVGVFDTFKKAENYCLLKGYEKTETEGVYKKEWDGWKGHYNWLSIEKTWVNEIIKEAEE